MDTVTNTRQRVAIAFMVSSMVATLVLGGAVAYELGRRDETVAVGSDAATAAGAAAHKTTATGSTVAGGTGAGTAAGGTPAAGAGGAGGSGSGAGAGGGSGGGGGTDDGTGTAGTVPVTGGVITVGGLFDETGPVDATVERDTVRAFFSMVNEQGGVNGKMLQLVDCDSKFNTTDGANCANKLINDVKVFAVVGWASAGGEDSTVKSFNDAGIPVIGGLGTPNEYKYPLSFPVSANFLTYGTAMGNRAADLGFKDVGLVIVNVPFIAPVRDELERSLKARGVTVKSTQLVDATKPNYADVVLDFQSKGVKAVVTALDPYSYQRLFQAMQGASFDPPLLGLGLDKGSVNPSPDSPNNGYGRFVEGMHSLTPMLEPADHPNDPAVRLYIDTVKKYFPNQVAPLDVYTEHSWTAAQLFVDALTRAGPNPTQQALVDALNATSSFQGGLTSVPLSYGPGVHDPNRCFWMLENKDLVWTSVTEPTCF